MKKPLAVLFVVTAVVLTGCGLAEGLGWLGTPRGADIGLVISPFIALIILMITWAALASHRDLDSYRAGLQATPRRRWRRVKAKDY